MSRILTEGFEYGVPAYILFTGTSNRATEWNYYSYSESTSRAFPYSGVVADGRTGGFGLRFRDYHTGVDYKLNCHATRSFELSDEIWGRIYFKVNGFTSLDSDNIQILDNADGQLLKFRMLKATKRLGVYDQGNVLVGTLPSINANEWIKLEFHLSLAVEGLIEIWQNGSLVFAFSGDTKGAKGAASKLRIGAAISIIDTHDVDFHITYDDIAINNAIGTFNNGRCGGGGVVGLKPTGAGTYAQFTPIGGTTNWGNLIDAPAVSDTSYNNSATPGNIDTFIFEKLADKGFTNTDLINAVSVEVCSKYYSEPANHAVYLKGVSEHEFGNVVSNAEYSLNSIITEIDPDTPGDRFTVSKIDSMEFGYKHKVV